MTEQIKDIESALKKVKDQKENFGFMDRFTVDENWEVTKALEKQIPKDYMKELSSDGFFKRNICPKCEDVRGLIKSYNFCPWCGQAIKWE